MWSENSNDLSFFCLLCSHKRKKNRRSSSTLYSLLHTERFKWLNYQHTTIAHSTNVCSKLNLYDGICHERTNRMSTLNICTNLLINFTEITTHAQTEKSLWISRKSHMKNCCFLTLYPSPVQHSRVLNVETLHMGATVQPIKKNHLFYCQLFTRVCARDRPTRHTFSFHLFDNLGES